MTSVGQKADYVRARARTAPGNHHCHYPGCTAKVPPSKWGCFKHWQRLPKRLQNKIWHTFQPGQEISKTPSAEYLAVAREVQEWCEWDARRVQIINRGWEYDL